MKEFSSTIRINAAPEAIWKILTDASSYPNWNPEIIRVDGTIALGQKLKAHVNLGKGKIQPVSVRVTEFDAPRRMVWTGGLPLGLFVGRRSWIVMPRGSGTTDFTMNVNFSGPLSGPIAGSLGDRQPDIDALAAGLKKFAERG